MKEQEKVIKEGRERGGEFAKLGDQQTKEEEEGKGGRGKVGLTGSKVKGDEELRGKREGKKDGMEGKERKEERERKTKETNASREQKED